jgi:signal transduction histidine kinase/ligand-binding sensor domain-containing protein
MYFNMRESAPRAMTCLAILLASCACAFALDPSLDISQYAHTSWKIRDGFPRGTIYAMTQMPDGYLWLGTEFGLYRFDGVRAVPWKPGSQTLPDAQIKALLLARDGTLWIGTGRGLASWKDGKLTQYPELVGRMVNALLQDRQGAVWVGAGQPGSLCAIRAGKVDCVGAENFGAAAWDLYEDQKGDLWVSASTGVWRWDSVRPDHYALPGVEFNGIIEGERGEMLFATNAGLKRLVGGRIQNYFLPGMPTTHFRPIKFFRSSDGSLWIGTFHSLLRFYRGRTDVFGTGEGLSGEIPVPQFEDREGNIWVSTAGGLDRFREYAVASVAQGQGLSSVDWAVEATSDGSVWISTSDGLSRWSNGSVTVYGGQSTPRQPTKNIGSSADSGLATPHGIGLDDQGRLWVAGRNQTLFFNISQFIPVSDAPAGNIWFIGGDGHGKLWMNDGIGGLYHFGPGEAAEAIPWSRLGQKGYGPRTMLPDRSDGGVWLGFWDGGIGYFKDGEVRASYKASDGLGDGSINDLRFGPRGSLWVATNGGLSRVRGKEIRTLTSKNGLPCDTVHWSVEDNDHNVWLYMPCGLVRIARSEIDAWAGDPNRRVQTAVFDVSDGVRAVSSFGGYGPRVSKDRNGRIWFVAIDAVSIIDPHNLHENKLPPPVHVEQVIADDKMVPISNGMHLPTAVRHLDIDYTALSLVVPEKVRFRVKLEGEDKDWRELANVRHVEYTNLPPKHYRFRVLACNNSGVWNEEGAALDFVIPPAWYQTNWFYALCAAAFLALLWAAYQLRVRQLAAQFNMRLEERVAERTRVARDLHDTLLQSFQALLPLLQAGINMFGSRPADALRTFEKAADHASQAIAEGRDAIQGMRTSTVEKNDLAVAIRTVGEELASGASKQPAPNFNVVVEGVSRNLHPILRDEVYRLAVEGLRNAFRHAAAQNVEVEIRYDEKYFRLRVRDDGKGIPSDVLSGDGREGHYGLPGMRERAKLVGGKLAIWTELDGGTEIELNIPGARAYVKSARPFWQFGKRSATETDEKEPIERE